MYINKFIKFIIKSKRSCGVDLFGERHGAYQDNYAAMCALADPGFDLTGGVDFVNVRGGVDKKSFKVRVEV